METAQYCILHHQLFLCGGWAGLLASGKTLSNTRTRINTSKANESIAWTGGAFTLGCVVSPHNRALPGVIRRPFAAAWCFTRVLPSDTNRTGSASAAEPGNCPWMGSVVLVPRLTPSGPPPAGGHQKGGPPGAPGCPAVRGRAGRGELEDAF